MESLTKFFEVNTIQDFFRIMKVPAFLGLEAGKYVMMLFCGCQVNELNNWLSQAMRTPYYWRTPNIGPRFVAGPYSPIWYLVNQPALLGYYVFMHYLFVFDVIFTIINFWGHRWPFILFYSANSIYFYDSNPIDFFLFNILMLSIYSWKLSVFAIVYKIPWFTLPFSTPHWFPFPPSYVWPFILNDPYGFHESPARYVQIAAIWLTSLIVYLGYYRKHGSIDTIPLYRLWYRIRDGRIRWRRYKATSTRNNAQSATRPSED